MGTKSKPSGSLVLDLRLGALGRIQKRTGYDNKKDLERLKDAIKGLRLRDEHDLIRAWTRDEVSNHEILSAYQTGHVHQDYLIRKRPLLPSIRDWVSSSHYVPENNRIYGHLLNRLEKTLTGHLLGDAPKVLSDIRAGYKKTQSTTDFNKLRKIILSYLKNNSPDKTDSLLYQQVRKVSAFSTDTHKRKNLHKPFDPNNLDFLLEEENIPSIGRDWIYWLCLHGLRPKEFWHDGWELGSSGAIQYVQVWGKKTKGAERKIPLLYTPPSEDLIPMPTIRRYLSKLGRSPYDCRRTYLVWLDNAKVPRNVIARWAGHRDVTTTTELYLLQEDLQWIKEHGGLLPQWLREQRDLRITGRDSDTFVPFQSRDDIGKNRQAADLAEVKDRLNALLEEWYQNPKEKWMRRQYRVDSLMDVSPD